MYYYYVPVSYIDSNINLGYTGVTGYTKISFYNAKSGEVVLFYNDENINFSTALKMYFPTKLDLINKTWAIESQVYPISATQLWAGAYNNKIKDTFTNFVAEEQAYPNGTAFNFLTGKYEII
jgi:hypothetical protein